MAKESLKERLKKKRAKLNEKKGGGDIVYLKKGTLRVRLLPVIQEEFCLEMASAYLKGASVWLPSTFGLPDPVVEAHKKLKKSKDDDDIEIAKKLAGKMAYVHPCIVYEDEKGKKIDSERSGKLVKFPKTVYQQLLDLWLDEDEWGDMTDLKKGYDVKIMREGEGMNDTEYTVQPCKNTPVADKKWSKPVDLEKAAKALLESYEDIQEKVDTFLGSAFDDDDEDDKKKKSKKASNDFGSKKKDKGKDKEKKSDKKSDKKSKSKDEDKKPAKKVMKKKKK